MPLLEGAASAAAGQAANQVAQDSIFGNLFTTGALGTDSILQEAMIPTIAEAGLDEVTLDSILKSGAFSGIAKPAGEQLASEGIMSQLSNLFGDKGVTNAIDIGGKAYGAYDTHQARKDAQDFQNKQLAMSQDAYNRNVEADEKRQSLNF